MSKRIVSFLGPSNEPEDALFLWKFIVGTTDAICNSKLKVCETLVLSTGQELKFLDCPGHSGTLGNYGIHLLEWQLSFTVSSLVLQNSFCVEDPRLWNYTFCALILNIAKCVIFILIILDGSHPLFSKLHITVPVTSSLSFLQIVTLPTHYPPLTPYLSAKHWLTPLANSWISFTAKLRKIQEVKQGKSVIQLCRLWPRSTLLHMISK